jgi:very-short-patch-repair endonuclease
MKEEYLRTSGWRLLRIKNDDIYQSLGAFEAAIISAIGD